MKSTCLTGALSFNYKGNNANLGLKLYTVLNQGLDYRHKSE